MKEKQIRNIIFKIQCNALNSKRTCLYKDCDLNSIKSHLLQKNGIITTFAENKHVYELAINPFAEGGHKFSRIGINEAFTFPGFCKEHDNNIFEVIETGEIDYFNYRTQLLFSYRALANEKRKKEIIVDYFTRLMNSSILRQNITPEYFQKLNYNIKQQKLGIEDQTYYEDSFLSNIDNFNNKDFSFITVELPKIELCSSAVFTYETTNEINNIYIRKGLDCKEPLTEIYFNLIPLEETSIMIMGCLNSKKDKCWEYIESFNCSNSFDSLKEISDLLLCQVENWICSPSVYQNYFKKHEQKIIEIINESTKNINERRELGFNLFEEMIKSEITPNT